MIQNQTHPAITRYLSEGVCSPGPIVARQLSGIEDHIVCGEAVEVLSALPSNSIDLVHTSPPYNIDRPYESSSSDKNSVTEYLRFLRRVIEQLKRVVRPGGSIFWQTGYTQDEDSPSEIVPIDILSYEIFHNEPIPLLLWDRIIWRYWGGHAFTKKFTNKHETILWFVKPGTDPVFSVDAVRERSKEYDKRNNFWGRNPGNVWEVDRVAYGATEQTSHIAVFPEEVTERIIRACSEQRSLVLDPFAGSGTVPKVARGLGRRWIGIEISPIYAEEAAIRVGFQQPSEAHSLASGLAKQIGFNGKKGTISLDELARRVHTWAMQIPLLQLSRALDDDLTTASRFSRSASKREVWMKYDIMLEEKSGSTNPVIMADRLLLDCYKLRKNLNGVSRYKSALEAIKRFVEDITREQTTDYLQRIAKQEPSSFEISGSNLTLLSTRRSVATEESLLGGDGREDVQKRML